MFGSDYYVYPSYLVLITMFTHHIWSNDPGEYEHIDCRCVRCTCVVLSFRSLVQASSWEYSADAVRLIARYARAYPQLFHGLARHGGDRYLDADVSRLNVIMMCYTWCQVLFNAMLYAVVLCHILRAYIVIRT